MNENANNRRRFKRFLFCIVASTRTCSHLTKFNWIEFAVIQLLLNLLLYRDTVATHFLGHATVATQF